jgi:hypothetical protein
MNQHLAYFRKKDQSLAHKGFVLLDIIKTINIGRVRSVTVAQQQL